MGISPVRFKKKIIDFLIIMKVLRGEKFQKMFAKMDAVDQASTPRGILCSEKQRSDR
jgi:hypothetical protein